MCHGKLTPRFEYIAAIRQYNEKMNLKHADIYEEEETRSLQESAIIEEADKALNLKPMGKLRKNLSLVTVELEGHLFDTKCFNQAIDICEANGI